jgi:hypothetical protein
MTMRKPTLALFAAALAFAAMPTAASAEAPAPTTFVVVLDAESEVPQCGPATNASRGVAIFRVTDETAGTVDWTLVANNIPGNTTAAHIHIGDEGVAGPVRQPLAFTPGAENGVIGSGSFTNPALLAAIRANPADYYVNVHSSVCGPGVIRGQFGDTGP